MLRVIDDIKKYIENNFYIDDIDKIYAINFEGANSNKDILDIIANLEINIPSLIKREVGLYHQKFEGTHAYELELLDGSCVNIPVW